MLHALKEAKVRLRDAFNTRYPVQMEDVVTSTVFGPMDFMSEQDRSDAVHEIATSLGLKVSTSRSHPVSLSFWKRRRETLFRTRSIEPDLVIELGESEKIMLEVKWGANLSRDELAAQWASLSFAEQAESHHVLLTRNPKQYTEDIAENAESLRKQGIPSWRPKEVSWRELGQFLRRIADRSSVPRNVRAWADYGARFLAREEFGILQGWRYVGLRVVAPSAWRFKKETRNRWTVYSPVARIEWQFQLNQRRS